MNRQAPNFIFIDIDRARFDTEMSKKSTAIIVIGAIFLLPSISVYIMASNGVQECSTFVDQLGTGN